MAEITLHGETIETVGELPAVGTEAPPFTLTTTDMSDVSLGDFVGKTVVLNVFPSVDTSVCAASVRRFNEIAGSREDTVVLCISADLPFAHGRFCEAEGLVDVMPLSTFRSPVFGQDYGVAVATGPVTGLMSRAIVIVDGAGKVVYTEQVPEIGQEPDYDAVLAALAGRNGNWTENRIGR